MQAAVGSGACTCAWALRERKRGGKGGRGAAAPPPPQPPLPTPVAAPTTLRPPAGVQLLPESYAVLIYAAMESVTPPDLEVAKALYSALSSTGGSSRGGASHRLPPNLSRCFDVGQAHLAARASSRRCCCCWTHAALLCMCLHVSPAAVRAGKNLPAADTPPPPSVCVLQARTVSCPGPHWLGCWRARGLVPRRWLP